MPKAATGGESDPVIFFALILPWQSLPVIGHLQAISTTSATSSLNTPHSEARMTVVQLATAVASPEVEMVATLVSVLIQFTSEVISGVEPSV